MFDLPEPKLEVTEHIVLGCTCERCGSYNQGNFPDGVNARLQYGTGVKALIVLLNVAFKVPVKKVRLLFADLFGYPINPSTIINATQKCFAQLEQSEKAVKNSLFQSIVNYFDETGLRVAGSLHWLHTCCNGLFTYLFVHKHRGMEALQDAASILPGYKNRAVLDCLGSYFKFDECLHAICGAHLLRELVAPEEKGTVWASWFRRYLLTLYHLSKKGTGKLTPEEQQKALRLFDKIWEYADLVEPPPQKSASGRGRPKATKGRNLLGRFKQHQYSVFNELKNAFDGNTFFTRVSPS